MTTNPDLPPVGQRAKKCRELMRYWAKKWRESKREFDLGVAISMRNSEAIWRKTE